MTADDRLYRVVETDRMTSWDEYRSGPLSREAADKAIAVHEKVTIGRYEFKAVPVEPHMTDNGKARERHDAEHGSWPMEDCPDIACREASMRLLTSRPDQVAARDAEKGN